MSNKRFLFSVILELRKILQKVFIKKSLFKECITSEDGDIRKAISTIERGGLRIALIIGKDKKLLENIFDSFYKFI